MGRNLGPLNIKDSYQELVQISGSILTDGVGVNIDSLTVTASHATIADASISASYAQTSTSSSYALTASFAEGIVTPNLQEVLDAGNVSTTNLILTGSNLLQVGDSDNYAIVDTQASYPQVELRSTLANQVTLNYNNTEYLTLSNGGGNNNEIIALGNNLRFYTDNKFIFSGSAEFADGITGSLDGNATTAISA